METRRFLILYQRQRDWTLEREVIGTQETVLKTAWDMLQNGEAKVAAIVEPGNLEFHIWHNRIVRWGRDQTARQAKLAPRRTEPAPAVPDPQPVAQRPTMQRPAA
jgi:hypothetical protein